MASRGLVQTLQHKIHKGHRGHVRQAAMKGVRSDREQFCLRYRAIPPIESHLTRDIICVAMPCGEMTTLHSIAFIRASGGFQKCHYLCRRMTPTLSLSVREPFLTMMEYKKRPEEWGRLDAFRTFDWAKFLTIPWLYNRQNHQKS